MPANDTFRFQAEDHTYWLGDQRIVGVTEALTRVGVLDGMRFVDERALERGQVVHAWAAQYLRSLEGKEDPIPPARYIRGYCEAVVVAQHRLQLETLSIEQPRCHRGLHLGGTQDVVGRCHAPGYPKGRIVIDWKTGDREDWHELQLALYVILSEDEFGPIECGANVYIDAAGAHKPKFITITHALRQQALAMLMAAQWLIANR